MNHHTITTAEDIERFRLFTLRAALKLEIAGMKKRGRSAYSIIKTELKFKGNRARVLLQLSALLDKPRTKRPTDAN
jgi:hypothetical protein